MKLIKRIFIGLGIVLVLLIAAAFILPIVFKNDIKKAIDQELAKSVNADVVFDIDNFNLSLFRNFPSITAEISELGVFNRAPFEGEHLFVVDRLEVELNLSDLLFGSRIRIKGITLDKPQINVKVLQDGRANYDIAIPSKEAAPESEPSKFSFSIDHWQITGGELIYDDKSIPYFLGMKGIAHNGSGDFTQDIFDLRTHTTVDSLTTGMGTMEFLRNKHAEVDAVIQISDHISKFTFRDNKARVNDFAMQFDGWFKMNPDNYEMDIKFSSPENSFKSLLSLVPGIYTKDFKGIETKGDLSFNGAVKGIYKENQIPAFNLALLVKDAMFKYPSLPTAVSNIQMDLMVDNRDGIIDNTLVDLKKLHLDFGANPVDARARIENLKNYKLDASLKAKLNLAELNKMFPMKDTEMSGIFALNATANGTYDQARKVIPASGTLSIQNLVYKTAGMPALGLKSAEATFDPKKIDLKNLEGTVGKSDYKVTGQVSNYLGYAMNQETITGQMTATSNLLDLNEFMSNSSTTSSRDTTSFSVIPIPKNIDFVFKAKAGTVKMMDYTMTQAAGDIVLRNGIANLSGLHFNMLGGAFTMNGSYNTADLKHPRYDMGIKIDNLSIQQAANSFSMVKSYVPIAGLVNGNFSTDFKVDGELLQNMMPNLATVNGAGLIKIAQAVLTQSKIVAGITSLTSLSSSNSNQVSLKDVLMSASINNGRFSVKPFDVKFGDYATTVSGSTGLDGTLDYSLKMMVPAGKVGSQVQGYLNQFAGTAKPTDKIPVTIGLGGTYNDPKPKLLTTEQQAEVTKAAKAAAEEKGKQAAEQLVQGAKPEDVVKGILGTPAPKDTTKKDSTVKKGDPATDLLQNKLQNLLKKKKKDNP